MSRFTFLIVWLLLSGAGIATVHGGPFWAYPPAVFLALICAVFVTWLPDGNASRCALAALGCIMVFTTSAQFATEGITRLTVNQCSFGLLLGLAWVWASAFPLRETHEPTT